MVFLMGHTSPQGEQYVKNVSMNIDKILSNRDSHVTFFSIQLLADFPQKVGAQKRQSGLST